MHWRVYADGREFGIDYLSLAAARRAKMRYSAHFPHINYYIRCHRGAALAIAATSR